MFGLCLIHWIAVNGEGASASAAASGFSCGVTVPSGPVRHAAPRPTMPCRERGSAAGLTRGAGRPARRAGRGRTRSRRSSRPP